MYKPRNNVHEIANIPIQFLNSNVQSIINKITKIVNLIIGGSLSYANGAQRKQYITCTLIF